VLVEILPRAHIGRSPPTLRGIGSRSAFRLTLHDRHPSFGGARSPAVDMGGDLVAEVAVRRRAEPVNYAQTRRLANARICRK